MTGRSERLRLRQARGALVRTERAAVCAALD